MSHSKVDIKLENFDDLFVGDPLEIEKKLSDLLPQAKDLENKSIYLQILSQIALAQALQKKFTEAHKTLDKAESELTPEHELARVRILLERGRIFHQSDDNDAALPLFKESYELSKKYKLDFHTINAAHMVPLVEKDINEKIKWNKIAIDLSLNTQDSRASTWTAALYENLAENYLEAKTYNDALSAFTHAKNYAQEKGYPNIIRGAIWGIGRSLRGLGNVDEALDIQLELLSEYQDLFKKGEAFAIGSRGKVYEELAEIYLANVKKFSALAYQDLSQDPWFVKLEKNRLYKMKLFQEIETETIYER